MQFLTTKDKSSEKLSPTPRVVNKAQDVGKSGHANRSSLTSEDPMSTFNKQPRRWLHIDADGHVSYVTVCCHPNAHNRQHIAVCAFSHQQATLPPSRDGHNVLQVDKHRLVQELNIPYRDLRCRQLG
jgi:hypothetical protein